MSNIFALTEDAIRRAEGGIGHCRREEISKKETECRTDTEKLLLLAVILLLYRAGANKMLLLVIIYVTL